MESFYCPQEFSSGEIFTRNEKNTPREGLKVFIAEFPGVHVSHRKIHSWRYKGFLLPSGIPRSVYISKNVKNTPLEGQFDTMEGTKVFKAINYSVMSPWEYR